MNSPSEERTAVYRGLTAEDLDRCIVQLIEWDVWGFYDEMDKESPTNAWVLRIAAADGQVHTEREQLRLLAEAKEKRDEY